MDTPIRPCNVDGLRLRESRGWANGRHHPEGVGPSYVDIIPARYRATNGHATIRAIKRNVYIVGTTRAGMLVGNLTGCGTGVVYLTHNMITPTGE